MLSVWEKMIQPSVLEKNSHGEKKGKKMENTAT